MLKITTKLSSSDTGGRNHTLASLCFRFIGQHFLQSALLDSWFPTIPYGGAIYILPNLGVPQANAL